MKEAKPIKVSIEVDRTQVDEVIGRVDELSEKLSVVANTMKDMEDSPYLESFEKARGDFWHPTATKLTVAVGWLGGAILGIIIAKLI